MPSRSFRLGQFDPYETQPLRNLTAADVCTPDHIALALSAAEQGMTLLKNANGVLPLAASTIKTLAVVGPNLDGHALLGNYNGAPCAAPVSPAAALAAYANVTASGGCGIADNSTSGFAAAVAAAQQAAATVLVMGLDESQEAEGNDRTSIAFPGVQAQLIAQVCAAAKGACVLVVMAGNSVDLTAAVADPNVVRAARHHHPQPPTRRSPA